MKFKEVLIKNDIYREIEHHDYKCNNSTEVYDDNFLNKLRNDKEDIYEKQFGDISSFNFKRDVFFSGKWNELSKTARGLFVNNKNGNIICRGYEKFFNYKEGNFNNDLWLKNNLQFPVTAYKKYNGFLGILGTFNNELLFCSKSSIDTDYPNYFKNIFMKENHNIDLLKDFMIKNNIGLVFEVIDPINDPHIVKYTESKLILLDAIYLEEKFYNMSYNELLNIGKDYNFFVKEIEIIFNNYNELNDFIINQENDMSPQKEGYVLVDNNNYHFKLKCKWYKTWKFLRSFKDKVGKKHNFSTSCLTMPIMNYFIGWCKNKDSEYILNNNIITLRDDFYKENQDI